MKKAYTNMALLLFIFTLFIVPNETQAALIRTDRGANVQAEETLSENVYLVGGEPKFLGTVEGDVTVIGNNVEIAGNVNGDVLSLGGDLYIKGNISGDVRVLGGKVYVEQSIGGDLVAIGSEIIVAENAKISGELILIGAKVDIQNNVDTKMKVVSGAAYISGVISGQTNVTSEKINIVDGAEVSGELIYFSPTQAVVSEGAKVTGSVNYNQMESLRENGLVQHTLVSFFNFWMLFRFITTLVLTFVLVYMFKIFSQRTALRSVESFWKSLLIGAVSFLFIPVVLVVMLVSLILFPIAVILGMVYVGAFMISTAIAGMALGALIKKTFSKDKSLEVTFQTATLGVIILTMLQFVPVLGDITRFLFILAAFGSIWFYLYEKVRWGNSVRA